MSDNPDNRATPSIEQGPGIDNVREAIQKEQIHRWEFLNKPITIWILSTIVIGFLSFTFTNYKSCHDSEMTDEDTMQNYYIELNYRAGIYSAMKQLELSNDLSPDSQAFQEIQSRTDPNSSPMLPEFKGMATVALLQKVTRQMTKWGIYSPDQGAQLASSKSTADDLLRLAYYITDLSTYNEFFGMHSINQVQLAKGARDDYINIDKAVLALRHQTSFLPPAVCLKRSFWPFN